MTQIVDHYEINRAFLPPSLRETMDKIEPKGVIPHQGEKGLFTLKVKDFKGKEIFLHSPDDPVKEAHNLIASYSIKEGDLPIIFGFGLGYHIMETLSVLGFKERIVAVEPYIHIFKAALTTRNLVTLLSSPGIEFVLTKDPEEAFLMIGRMITLENLDKIKIIEHPQSILLNPPYYTRVKNLLLNEIDIKRANLEAFGVFALMWTANILENFQEIITNPPVETLFGKFKEIPAIIISAGPSLDKNINELKRVEDKALLVCVGSALKSCLAHGIRPHLVVDVDARPEHLKKFEGIDLEGINLVADPIIYPKILKRFKATKFILTYGHPIVKWVHSHYKEKKFELSPLRTGGSASTVAFDFARKVGADPIIFIGLDLSFSHDKIYAHGAYTDKRLERGYRMDEATLTEDIRGEKVWTNRRMMLYKTWFEDELTKTSSLCINATEGGILKKGVILMSLLSAINTYCGRKIDIDGILRDARSLTPKLDLDNLRRDMKGFIDGFSKLSRISDKALKLTEKERDWRELNGINEQIDKIPASLLIKEVIEGLLWEVKKKGIKPATLSSLYRGIQDISKKIKSIFEDLLTKI